MGGHNVSFRASDNYGDQSFHNTSFSRRSGEWGGGTDPKPWPGFELPLAVLAIALLMVVMHRRRLGEAA